MSNKKAPVFVLAAKINRSDPAIKTRIAASSKTDANDSGTPLETIKATVDEKSVIFPGTAFTKRAPIKILPTKSKSLTLSTKK